jgi:hypothetical protein
VSGAGNEHDPACGGTDRDSGCRQRQQARAEGPAAGGALAAAHAFQPAPLALHVGRSRPLFVHRSLYVVVGPSVTVRASR